MVREGVEVGSASKLTHYPESLFTGIYADAAATVVIAPVPLLDGFQGRQKPPYRTISDPADGHWLGSFAAGVAGSRRTERGAHTW